jgi:hypothetical protein
MTIKRKIEKPSHIPKFGEERPFEEKCPRCTGEGAVPKDTPQEGPTLVVTFAGGVEMYKCDRCSGAGVALTEWGREVVDHLIGWGFKEREELVQIADLVESSEAIAFPEEEGKDVPKRWVERGYSGGYWLRNGSPPDDGSPEGR